MYLAEQDKKRFWSKADVRGTDDCWEWQASKNKVGYGQFWLSGYYEKAHRVAFFISNEGKQVKKFVLHTCDNPSCVNPNHLYEGSQANNMNDMYRRNSTTYSKGKLNEECVKVIKWMLKYKYKRGLVNKLAELHKVRHTTISEIKNNHTWAHITI